MSVSENIKAPQSAFGAFFTWGMLWLALATAGATFFFMDGLEALLRAWQLPEYSHGPLIPILSGLLFLRQLKTVPVNPGPVRDRWVGVCVLLLAVLFGSLGKLSGISDIVAYASIIWVGGILLISFGWKTGKHFWPPVLHLVYMLPLPDVFYHKMSNFLQLISSELGVYFLKLLGVAVYLEGNIIDLGVYKLHVADACSGLRYLFPILSFSYIFAVLYKGPMWHKAVLLLSAAPITILMNSVRIAIAGVLVDKLGLEWLEGFTHFFEGWVIFIACILLLFLMARIMLWMNPQKMSLADALDLDTDGLWDQAKRLRLVQPSTAMISAAGVMLAVALAWQAVPERDTQNVSRDTLQLFPQRLGEWQRIGAAVPLAPEVEAVLQADDYLSINLGHPDHKVAVGLFMAWYQDQTNGGVHSPEICLPGAGWEIAWLERSDISGQLGLTDPFEINRAVIQKGETRMLVYYWFEQKGKRIAWDMQAKVQLMIDGIMTGRTDGGMVRLTTLIQDGETDAQADARMLDITREALPHLPRFMPQQ